MRYLVTTLNHSPFLTEWFDPENHFNPDPDMGMVVYDLFKKTFTTNGMDWRNIELDSL